MSEGAAASRPLQQVVRVMIQFEDNATSTEPLSFTYYAPPTIHSLTALGHTDGDVVLPLGGGVPITLIGDNFASLSNESAICAFGYEPTDRRRSATPATVLSPTTLRCQAPSASWAGGHQEELSIDMGATQSYASVEVMDFVPPPLQHATLQLLGTAVLEHGTLILTRSVEFHEIGSAWVSPSEPHAPLTAFALYADVLIGYGTEGDGMSVVYGPPTSEPFGEMGPSGSAGLVLRLRTGDEMRVELLLGGKMLASARVEPHLRSLARVYSPLVVRVEPGAGISVRLASTMLLANVSYPDGRATEAIVTPSQDTLAKWDEAEWVEAPAPIVWSPQPTWKVGFGARVSYRSAEHHVRFITLRSAHFASTVSVPVEVSGNGGADFSQGGPLLRYAHRPMVSWMSPLAGPIEGGTALTLRGPSLCSGTRPLSCRLGGVTLLLDSSACSNESLVTSQIMPPAAPPPFAPLSANGSTAAPWPMRWQWPTVMQPRPLLELGTLSLTTPPSAGAAHTDRVGATDGRIQLTLNGVQWHLGTQKAFTYYTPPEWLALSPEGGPVQGGTVVTVEGGANASTVMATLQAGNMAAARCKFGVVAMPGTVLLEERSIRCVAPPRSGSGAVTVRISLNGQQYNDPGGAAMLVFTYYHRPTTFDLYPPQGLTMGGTSVTLRGGSGLGGGVAYSCRFGYWVVPGTYSPDAGGLVCASPHAHLALAVTHTEQQSYYGGLSRERSGDGAIRLRFSDESADGDEYKEANVTIELRGAARLHGGALRLTETLSWAPTGAARIHIGSPRPPLHHLSVSMDIMMTGPFAGSSEADYPFGLTVGFGGVYMPAELAGLGVEDVETLSATTAEAGGVRILLAYGAARDVRKTNASIATYVRVVHAPPDGSPAQEHISWLPWLELPSRSWRRFQLRIIDSQLDVFLDDNRLVGAVMLTGWRPAASWALGLHGSRNNSFHHQRVDNVQIASGALRSVAEVPVWISRNGQQYDGVASHTFGYRAPPVVSSVVPRAGAAWAITSVVVRGSNFGHGTDYKCIFGDVFVAAAYNATDGSLLCAAPSRNVSAEEHMTASPRNVSANESIVVNVSAPSTNVSASESIFANVSASLNGIEGAFDRWVASDPIAIPPYPFEFVQATAHTLVPALGPTTGGVLVVMHGAELGRGHDRHCIFGAFWSPATLSDGGRALKCIAPDAGRAADPAFAGTGGHVPVQLSLNGQDANFLATPLDFLYYTPPIVSAIHPPTGARVGGTTVTLSGRGFGGASALLRCRFGVHIINSEPNATDGMLSCVTPPATAAAAALELGLQDCRVRGWAALLASGEDGEPSAQLTPPTQHDTEGSLLCEPSIQPLYGAPTNIEVRFEIRLGDMGDGASLSYGDLWEEGGLGLHGDGMGLRLQFHTQLRPPRLHVIYRDIKIHSLTLPPIRDAFVPFVLAYDRGAHGGAALGLTVIYDGRPLLRGVPVPGWDPQPGWLVGFGSRSGIGANDCQVRRLRLWVGAPVEAQTTPLHITRNGQDYFAQAPDFTYFGLPLVSSITPSSGPTAGGSMLLIAGEALRGGSDYYCRFDTAGGGIVDAETNAEWTGPRVEPLLNTTADAPFVHCLTPSGLGAGVLTPQLSLNGQDETTSAVAFRFYDPPALTSISPSSGPALGATEILLSGANLTSLGSQLVCRFGPRMWARDFGALSILTPTDGLAASYGVAARAPHGLAPNEVPATILNHSLARCVSPPSVHGPHTSVPLEISLNGHDFTESAHHFQYYSDTTALVTVFPISDSSLGGRSLVLTGSGFTNGSNVFCRWQATDFGTVYTRAIAQERTILMCPSPAVPEGAIAAQRSRVTGEISTRLQLVLDVTLNGQQYSLDPSLTFSVIAGEVLSPKLLAVTPTLGPANGSSVVTVLGLTMEFGSIYLCRFGVEGSETFVGAVDSGLTIVNGSYDDSISGMRCVSPPHRPETVELAVTLNAEHWERRTFNYSFYAEPRLVAVSPASGPAFDVQCTAYDCVGGALNLGTLVTVSGSGMAAGMRSHYRCRFNATVMPATLLDDSAVRCYSPGSVAPGATSLRLSLNDQDYTLADLSFYFEDTPVVSAVLPALGPEAGGTNITLLGLGLSGGSHYECRFGGHRVPAVGLGVPPNTTASGTRTSAVSAVACVSPPFGALAVDDNPAYHRMELHRAPIALSLNGQQFTSTGQYFAYHHEAELRSLIPTAGPSDGGLLLTLRGDHLDGGDRSQFERLWLSQLEDVRRRADYRCRVTAADTGDPIATVPATWHALEEVIVCVAPRLSTPNLALNASVAVSLNAETYTATRVPFAYVPPPALSAISPLSGPSLGGVVAEITGSGFDGSLGLACQIESAIVEASIASPSSVRCRTPSLSYASPTAHQGYAFAVDDLRLRGGASVLRLSDAQLSSAIELSAPGREEPSSFDAPFPIGTPPLLDFEASWLLLLPPPRPANTTLYRNEARLAFRYGPLPVGAFGGEGAVEGLSVSLSDGGPPLVVEVRYAGTTLLSRVLGATIAEDFWTRITVNVTNGFLRVTSDEFEPRVLVDGLALAGWAPTRAWQMGIGAHGSRERGRYVDTMRLRSSLILGLHTVGVSLRMQDQLVSNSVNFTYTADAVVSSIEPRSGPVSAPTRLTIYGANFNLGLAVNCRFEQDGNSSLAPAELATNSSDAEINCTVSEDIWRAGAVQVFVALGPQATFGPGTSFLRYATPTLRALSPLVGVGNSTLVRIAGEGLMGGTDRRCRFGATETAATIADPTSLHSDLLCIAPPTTAAGSVAVQISLNGVQYTQEGAALSFRYLVDGFIYVSSVTPKVGPISGNTNVSVYGSNFVEIDREDGLLACRFGSSIVNATYVSEAQLLCTAPPATTLGIASVHMSLNRQEYYAGTEFFYMPSSGGVQTTVPTSKGRNGGGETVVYLEAALNATAAARASFSCRFGVCGEDERAASRAVALAGCAASPGTVATAVSIRCEVPPAPISFAPGDLFRPLPLYLAPNGAQFSLGPANFTFLAVEPTVMALEPPIGPIRGGTLVHVRGDGLSVGDQQKCRLGQDVEVPASKMADGSGLICSSPPRADVADVPVVVTFNGVDWISNSTHGDFTYTTRAEPSLVVPASGPRYGGTSIYLAIHPRFESHMDIAEGLAACRIGNSTMPATFERGSGFLRCTTMPGPVDVETPVSASINGQQFEAGTESAEWHYHYSLQDLLTGSTGEFTPPTPPSAPPPLGTPGSGAANLTSIGEEVASSSSSSLQMRVTPLTGPTVGGTRITLNATFALTIATNLYCRFGHEANSEVPGTLDPESIYMATCESPPLPTLVADAQAARGFTIPFGLSLNGQDYFDFTEFQLYPPAELPMADGIMPVEVAINGGLDVNISGMYLGGGSKRTCHIGTATTEATHYDTPSGEILRCRMPSADAAGFRTSLTVPTTNTTRFFELATLHGHATLQGRALQLVSRAPPRGTPFPFSGAVVVHVPPGRPPLPYFEVTFDVLFFGATARNGGMGLSFNYGPITNGAALDVSGSGHDGLAVSIRTGIARVIEVRLKGYLMLSAPIGTALPDDVWVPISIRHEEFGGLTVRCGLEKFLLEQLELPSFTPQPHWQIALAASSAGGLDETDEHWVFNLRIASGSLLTSATLPLRISLNGQQLDPPEPRFYLLRTLPVIESGSPLLGSSAGGTHLHISGMHLQGGPARLCRFGEPSDGLVDSILAEASYAGDGVGIVCQVPPVLTPGVVDVRMTLNGEQFSLASVRFTYHEPLSLTGIAPTSGPPDSNTIVELSGLVPDIGLPLGHKTVCHVNTSVHELLVPASFVGDGSVRCRMPNASRFALDVLPADVTMRVSINDVDVHVGGPAPLKFTYVPTHNVTHIAPSFGPQQGATLLVLNGAHLASLPTTRCRFGRKQVDGLALSGTSVSCTAPPFAEAAAVYEHPTDESAFELRGTAYASGATIVLTNASKHFGGTLVLASRNPKLADTAPAAFRISFEVRAFGGPTEAGQTHGDGYSVSWGLIPDTGTLGERGGGAGLRVGFLTRPPHPPPRTSGLIVITLMGRVIHERWITPADPALRGDAYREVLISYELAHGLSVVINGVRLVDSLNLRLDEAWWMENILPPLAKPVHTVLVPSAPTQSVKVPYLEPEPGWVVALSARCSRATDQHSVRRVSLVSGLQLTGGEIDVDVTLNGQDFEPGVRFTYFDTEHVSPTSGPAAGGTLVRLNGTSLTRGTSPTCRFGALAVEASVVLGTGDLVCTSPSLAVGVVVLSLALDGMNEQSAANFTVFRQASVHRIFPASGSREGGALVHVFGERLAMGEKTVCRFGAGAAAIDVDASVMGNAQTEMRCVAPRLDATDPVGLRIALNGQQFTSDDVVWSPLEYLEVLDVQPGSGPVEGGTNVSVVARGLVLGTRFRCRFGNVTVPAIAEKAPSWLASVASAATLVCVAPTMLLNLTGVPLPTANDSSVATASALAVEGANATNGTLRLNMTNSTERNTTNASVPDAADVAFVWPPSAYWPPLPLALAVEVSANGVDYSMSVPPFYFYWHEPVPAHLEPPVPPVGPIHGGTAVQIDGVPTAAASQPGCRFGSVDDSSSIVMVNASVNDTLASRTFYCTTPAMAAGTVPIALTLNGQQWAETTLQFRFYPPPRVETVLPDISPNVGGLVIELSGDHLEDGSDYRCRFDRRIVVLATHDAQSSSVLCVSPPGLIGPVSVAVTLNGQQYSEGDQPRDGAILAYYDVESGLLP